VIKKRQDFFFDEKKDFTSITEQTTVQNESNLFLTKKAILCRV